jgi:hypothetical protein
MKLRVWEVFEMIMYDVCYRRRENPYFDGKGYWQPIKQILEGGKIRKGKNILNMDWKKMWKQPLNNLKKKKIKGLKEILDLPEYYTDSDGKERIIEKNHFKIQTIRIPATEEPSLKKLIQIALNIGQYWGVKGGEFVELDLPYKNIGDFVNDKYAMAFIVFDENDKENDEKIHEKLYKIFDYFD